MTRDGEVASTMPRAMSERGSAVAEFAMVVVMLMMLFLALVNVGLWAYSHALLTNAAAQSARYAANSDINADRAASARAAEIMSHSLAAASAGSVICDIPAAPDPVMIEVHCTMDSPGIVSLLSGILPDVSVTAHTLRERP